jgi:hypothetical protein
MLTTVLLCITADGRIKRKELSLKVTDTSSKSDKRSLVRECKQKDVILLNFAMTSWKSCWWLRHRRAIPSEKTIFLDEIKEWDKITPPPPQRRILAVGLYTWYHFTWCVNFRTTYICSNTLVIYKMFFFFLKSSSLVQTINSALMLCGTNLTAGSILLSINTTRCFQSTVLTSIQCCNILVRREMNMKGLICANLKHVANIFLDTVHDISQSFMHFTHNLWLNIFELHIF